MRPFLLVLLPLSILPGCRGYLADHVRPEASIMAPELTRYGFGAEQSQCVSGKLAGSLSVWQLRQLANVTRLIKEPSRLNPGELVRLSSHVKDERVPAQVRAAAEACDVGTAASASMAAADAPPASSSTAPAASSDTPERAAPSAAAAPAAAARSMWLNLGSGADKQSISVDASTVQGEKPVRQAWFRILAAGAATSPNSYLLQINCTAKTVNPLASRKHDASGAITEELKHGENGAGANAIQGGSVIEIAYLSLCT